MLSRMRKQTKTHRKKRLGLERLGVAFCLREVFVVVVVDVLEDERAESHRTRLARRLELGHVSLDLAWVGHDFSRPLSDVAKHGASVELSRISDVVVRRFACEGVLSAFDWAFCEPDVVGFLQFAMKSLDGLDVIDFRHRSLDFRDPIPDPFPHRARERALQRSKARQGGEGMEN